MKKVVIKTALITLASIIVASGIFYGCLCAFAPKTLSDFYHNAGNEQLAYSFAENAYKNNSCVNNLSFVTERAISAGNNKGIKEYGGRLLEMVKVSSVSAETSYVYYIASEYCACLYADGEKQKAISEAVAFSLGYEKLNPLEKLMALGFEADDKSFMQELGVAIEQFKNTYLDQLSESAKARLTQDQNLITAYLN